MSPKFPHIYIIAGEESGDKLGSALMSALKEQTPCSFSGVGGALMAQQGVKSLFDMDDIAVMGFSAVMARLPKILKRINETAKAVIEAKPDILILIDSPDFTHRVAKKVRAVYPDLPIIDYICPSVWAWRPKRAEKMAAYITHVLAILPFEPEVLKKLRGPEATYIGHPLVSEITPRATSSFSQKETKTVLLLPGSRMGEVKRLLPVFFETVSDLVTRQKNIEFILPAVPRLKKIIEKEVQRSSLPIDVVSKPEDKKTAFERADVALTASGTVCLELALYNIPMISTYKLDPIARQFRFLVKIWTANLPNLIVDYPAVPEFIDEFVRSALLYRLLDRLLQDGPERNVQQEAFKKMRFIFSQDNQQSLNERAASVILGFLKG